MNMVFHKRQKVAKPESKRTAFGVDIEDLYEIARGLTEQQDRWKLRGLLMGVCDELSSLHSDKRSVNSPKYDDGRRSAA